MKRFGRWFGCGVVVLAVALLAAIFVHPMILGGCVEGGKVEDGRYFVVAKGHRYTEVSETQWRIEQYVECAFPWLPVMMIWIGVALGVGPDMDRKPVPRASAMAALWIALGAVVGTGAFAVARSFNCGVPWTIALGVWLALWGSGFFLGWLQSRSPRPPSNAGPDAAPDSAA